MAREMNQRLKASCIAEGPGLRCQHSQGGSRPFVTLVLGNPASSVGTACMWCIYTHGWWIYIQAGRTPTHMKISTVICCCCWGWRHRVLTVLSRGCKFWSLGSLQVPVTPVSEDPVPSSCPCCHWHTWHTCLQLCTHAHTKYFFSVWMARVELGRAVGGLG